MKILLSVCLNIILVFNVIACSNQQVAESISTPLPIVKTTPILIQQDIHGICTEPDSNAFDTITNTKIIRFSNIPSEAKSSTIRIVEEPGPERTNCKATTGIIVAKYGNRVIVATAGIGAELADTFWFNQKKIHILGRGINPGLVIGETICSTCRAAKIQRIATLGREPRLIVGYTSGSNELVGHPAQSSDGPYTFKGIGSIETWAYSLVPESAKSSDGIWTREGQWIGIAYAEEQKANTEVYRIIYIPASDILSAAKSTFNNK